jgi:type III restriction enzyme
MRNNKEIYELILRKKDELLSLGNAVEFIFSHTALGVGWDNPNVFNIATLNTTFSETRKRQEIGRGLRICVNQNGERVYDDAAVTDEARINELTVIPNETAATFIAQYQQEIRDVYGNTQAGASLKITHQGEQKKEFVPERNSSRTMTATFRGFRQALATRMEAAVVFPGEQADLVNTAVEKINRITIPETVVEATSRKIRELAADSITQEHFVTDTRRLETHCRFSRLDLIGELSEATLLDHRAIIEILKRISNHDQLVKNPPRFLFEAANIIRQCALDAMTGKSP